MKSLYQDFINELSVPFDRFLDADVTPEEFKAISAWADKLATIEVELEKDPEKNKEQLNKHRCFKINIRRLVKNQIQ